MRTLAGAKQAGLAKLSGLIFFERGKSITAIAAALFFGLCFRYAWAFTRQTESGLGEADRVAIALANGRGFADAYRFGQGPTAHLLPVSPSITALIYRMCGVYTPVSTFLISSWSIGLCFSSYILLNCSFARVGVPPTARAAALIFLFLVPVYLGQESHVLGVWDGGLTVALTALVLTQLTKLESFDTAGASSRLAITNSLLIFTNPIFGLAGFAATLVTACHRWTLRKFIRFGAVALVCLACTVGPWAMRNALVLGSPILTRTNAGLELSLATNPMMLTSMPHDIAFSERLKQIHPSVNEKAYDEVRRIGEVAYSRELGTQAWKWMKAHPWDEARLIVFHLRNTFAPEPWMFRVWSTPTGSTMRSLLASMAGLLGLAGVLFGLITNRRSWTPVAIVILLPALMLSPFQPISRYIYSFYAMLIFSAASAISSFFSALGFKIPFVNFNRYPASVR